MPRSGAPPELSLALLMRNGLHLNSGLEAFHIVGENNSSATNMGDRLTS